ncbi:MAG: HAD-IIB family hydrolase [Deltaproteobacteria bacterium]|nr:HAD-IIB family hydrolase [Deltaproteobacteria bacterium]
MKSSKPVIFTDLDGTLLFKKDYSFEPARPTLERIKNEGIPLVFASSKTRAEIIEIRKKLNNNHPFISENGGAIYIPKGYFPFDVEGEDTPDYKVITFGRPYDEIRKALVETREGMGGNIIGFGDLTEEDINKMTGMDLADAKLAKEREFDEPIFFRGSMELEREFFIRIEEKGLSWTRGRFYHILGKHDKGMAVKVLKDYYRKLYGDISVIGAGDGANDLPFLRESDYPVIVKRDDGRYEQLYLDGLIKADGIGPEGWNKAIAGILDSLSASKTATTR